MIPAAAAIPFMTLRLSIFGKKFPSGQRERTEQAARKPVIRPFEIHNFDVEERDRPLMSSDRLKRVPSVNAKGDDV